MNILFTVYLKSGYNYQVTRKLESRKHASQYANKLFLDDVDSIQFQVL